MTDFDPAKDAINISKHRISLERWIDLVPAVTILDERYDYGEERLRSYGWIDGTSYCLTFTIRDGAHRPISLRRAHQKEMRRYVSETT